MWDRKRSCQKKENKVRLGCIIKILLEAASSGSSGTRTKHRHVSLASTLHLSKVFRDQLFADRRTTSNVELQFVQLRVAVYSRHRQWPLISRFSWNSEIKLYICENWPQWRRLVITWHIKKFLTEEGTVKCGLCVEMRRWKVTNVKLQGWKLFCIACKKFNYLQNAVTVFTCSASSEMWRV